MFIICNILDNSKVTLFQKGTIENELCNKCNSKGSLYHKLVECPKKIQIWK